MKNATGSARKTTITLAPPEQSEVVRLRLALGCASNVDVVRRALALLSAETEREALRQRYRLASLAVREVAREDLAQFDAIDDGCEQP